MKVALLSDAPYCKDVRAQRTVEALHSLGYEIFILDQGFETTQSQALMQDNMHLFSSPIPSTKLKEFWWHVGNNCFPRRSLSRLNAWAVKKLEEIEPDVIHVVNPFLAEAALTFRKIYKTKIVYEAYEYWPEYLFDEEFGVKTAVRNRLAQDELQILASADTFIMVSLPLMKRYQNMVQVPSSYVIFNNNVSDPQIAHREEKILTPHRPLRVVFSGQFAADRNVPLLLKALPLMKSEIEVTLMGAGPQKGQYLQLIDQLDIGDSVKLREPVPASKLIEALSDYDVGVHLVDPSTLQLDGAVPNKVFDYLRAHLAIVALRSAGIESLSINEAVAYVPANEPEAIAEVIDQLAADKKRVAAMKNAAKTLAGVYSRENEVKKIVQIYRDIQAD